MYFHGKPRANMKHDGPAALTPPSYPGGLLGGKPSKLQALAAARKKKSESRSSVSVDEAPAAASGGGIADTSARPKREADGGSANLEPALKRLNLSRTSDDAKAELGPQSTSMVEAEPTVESRRSPAMPHEECIAPKISHPTSFGATLFGVESAAGPQSQADPLPFPYMASPLWNPDAFKKPSPDDIVISAQSQSKGSGFGGARN
jgi:elongation factor 1 alpha-like protein